MTRSPATRPPTDPPTSPATSLATNPVPNPASATLPLGGDAATLSEISPLQLEPDERRVPSGDAGKRRCRILQEAVEEVLFGESRVSDLYDAIAPAVDAAAADANPWVRRQSLPFRLWQSRKAGSDATTTESFDELALVAGRFDPTGAEDHGDAFSEILIGRELSAAWMNRGRHELAAAASENEVRWSRMYRLPELYRCGQASLGFVLTLAGFVDDGLGLITRSAAYSMDCSTYQFIGVSLNTRLERHMVIEFADADEHTRNYSRALMSYQTALAMIGPNEHHSRTLQYWALVRCLCKIGKPEVAAETYAQIPAPAGLREPVLKAKELRTATLLDSCRGDVEGALERCASGLSRFSSQRFTALYREVALEGSSIARAHDEPRWIIDQLGPDDYVVDGGVALMGTYAYEDLAWAYRRVGDDANARRCRALALRGRARFSARAAWGPDLGAAPGVLVSSQALHLRARRSRSSERQSLQRGISSVVHDLRSQLQSLELLTDQFSKPLPDHVEPVAQFLRPNQPGTPVASIINTFDDTLGDLLNDIDTDRAIELADLNLADLLCDTVERFASYAETKQISLVCEIDPTMTCRADTRSLDRIASNLVSNAIKYSPIGGAVLITATTVGDALIDVHFTDSGPGIPPDEIDQLFGWGSVLSSTPTGGETQNGIGLFNAHRLARLIGATIRPHPRTTTTASTMTVRLLRPGGVRSQCETAGEGP